MTEAKIRLYRFLVEMNRITKEEFKEITGMDYEWLSKKIGKIRGRNSRT